MNHSLPLLSLMMLCLLAPGCIEPKLHLHKQAATRVVLDAKVDVSVMWTVDWEAVWSFPWSAEVLGPLTYPEPRSMSLHIYPLDAESNPKSHEVKNFFGTSAELDISVGMMDLLFHNNDSEALQFTQRDELEIIDCTTRIVSSGIKASFPVKTVSQKADTKAPADSLAEEPVALMPDALFSEFVKAFYVSDDLSDYEFIDGRYVLRIEGKLQPLTYIHLIQINLHNNAGRVVGSNGGVVLTGMASGVELRSRLSSASTVSVINDAPFSRATDQFGIRMLSFGLPGCNPYDAASVAAAPGGEHFLVLNVTYMDGTWRNIRINVTDAVRALPLGGVITLDLDVDDFPPEHAIRGDGFQALIDDWQEIHGSTTIIQ